MTKSFFTFSGRSFLENFILTYQRFPVTSVFALAVSGVLCMLIYNPAEKNFEQCAVILHACALAVPLFLGIELVKERHWVNSWLLYLSGLLFTGIYYQFSEYPAQSAMQEVYYIRFVSLAVFLHLVVAFIPFLRHYSLLSFWQYNRTLFLSFLTAVLYSTTLFAGLSLAILAIDQLFEVQIPERIYGYLAAMVFFFFNTLLFVGNIPDLHVTDQEEDFPKGLRLFTQYVLLPLVALYVLILLGYEVKILVQWTLPKGWVSYLVLCSGIFGILAFLLVYPLKESTVWVRRFNRYFYWLLIPLILLMMVAIYTRIDQYGVTEPRYLVALLACWLFIVSLYFIVSRKDDIRFIPVSLAIVLLLASVGPLSGFEVAKRNQKHRLSRVLERYNLLKEGKLVYDSGKELKPEDAHSLSAALDFMGSKNWEELAVFIPEKEAKELSKIYPASRKERIMKLLNLKYTGSLYEENNIQIYRQSKGIEKSFKADYYLPISLSSSSTEMDMEGDSFKISYKRTSDTQANLYVEAEELKFEFSAVLNYSGNVETEKLTFRAESAHWRGVFVLDSYNQYTKNEMANVSGVVYLIRKPAQTF